MTADAVPAAQLTQDVAPMLDWYFPAEHLMHIVELIVA